VYNSVSGRPVIWIEIGAETLKEILRLENISYQYQGNHAALRDVSVTLNGKERVAVLGNNGAGKSTFFLCCNGILKPQSGKIYLNETAVGRSKKELSRLRQTVGLVFQDPDSQIIAGTVEAEISFGPMNLGLPEKEVRCQVDGAIDKMQLEDFRNRAPHYLSGGEKKRVSIADVLAMNPELLLLDEPASSLDPANTRLLERNLDILTEKGMGLVIATHDVDFAWRWAERILVFNQGTLAADGTPEAVFSDAALLECCGLEQPTLFQVGQIFYLSPLPKRISDLIKQ
jgi:cobalt/nickel transport system ATP-binding protein